MLLTRCNYVMVDVYGVPSESRSEDGLLYLQCQSNYTNTFLLSILQTTILNMDGCFIHNILDCGAWAGNTRKKLHMFCVGIKYSLLDVSLSVYIPNSAGNKYETLGQSCCVDGSTHSKLPILHAIIAIRNRFFVNHYVIQCF